jgi:hypothetical protein
MVFFVLDLQFSSEEGELEEVVPDDDSHQVAEAMVQLGNIAYYAEPPHGQYQYIDAPMGFGRGGGSRLS